MPEDQSFAPLKRYVRERGGFRLAARARFRDQCVDWAVADWPTGELPGEVEDRLRERLVARTEERYGSILATLLIGIAVNLICRLIVEWWKARQLNRTLMATWHYAETNPPVPPADRP
jgi:hypothetical protein